MTELLSIFRLALEGLLPAMKEAHISWEPPHAYDDWDEIVDTLYRRIVIESLAWATPDPDAFFLPPYGTVPDRDQSRTSHIEVSGPFGSGAFHSLVSTGDQFDQVRCVQQDHERVNLLVPFDGSTFALARYSASGQPSRVFDLAVEL